MERTIKVTFRNNIIEEFPANVTLLEVAEKFQKYFNYPILVARVDNKLEDLNKELSKKCDVDFYDRSSVEGNTVYSHSAQFLLIIAIKHVLGKDAEIKIEHSIDKGVYCEIEGVQIDKPLLHKIETEMHNLVKLDLIFTKVSVDRIDAISYFKKQKQIDKVNVLKYISNSYVNLYRLDEYYDYFFSEMAYSTRQITDFTLTYMKDNGFVLSYPSIYNPECTLEYYHRKMVFDTFLDYTKWGRIVGISTASDLNKLVSEGKYNSIIRLAEAHFEGQLAEMADRIYEKKDQIKVVLLAGPSSSGKTTTSRKLEIYLQAKGFQTHSISTDDYFVNRNDNPKDENGENDYETIKALDLTLFNKHLSKLLEGEKVLLPEYNFVTGEREYKKNWLQLKEKDIVIIEGLHSLNDDLTASIERKFKFKIFISPFTQLNIDFHNRIHTSDTRRLRRIIRDNKHRGYNAADTLRMWRKIREGEEKYIYPYQDDVDGIINSALIYELGVLKTYAEPLLFSVDENDEMYPEAIRLINFLRNFLPIPSDEVPKDSVLREFIGGSGFER